MAKNWFDGPIPTPEIGILGGLPSLQLTEEDKRRALAQMFLQGGLATAAASLGGANTSQALGKGLLGGADAYGQGLQAPAARMDAYAKQLKMQGDQIGNAKGMEELAKLKRDAADYVKQNDFYAMLNDPGRAAMLYGGGPSVANEQRATQFGANPASIFSILNGRVFSSAAPSCFGSTRACSAFKLIRGSAKMDEAQHWKIHARSKWTPAQCTNMQTGHANRFRRRSPV